VTENTGCSRIQSLQRRSIGLNACTAAIPPPRLIDVKGSALHMGREQLSGFHQLESTALCDKLTATAAEKENHR